MVFLQQLVSNFNQQLLKGVVPQDGKPSKATVTCLCQMIMFPSQQLRLIDIISSFKMSVGIVRRGESEECIAHK